jgi:hypothetical protein
MDRLPTAEECLSKAQECLAFAEDTSNDELRQDYLRLAQALTEFAAALEMRPKIPRTNRSTAQ